MNQILPSPGATTRMRFVVPQFGLYQKTTRNERREMARRQQAVRDAFAQHCAWLRQTAPPPLSRLQDMDLSDGYTPTITWEDSTKRLSLRLVCGNLQTGYFDVSLRFRNVDISYRDLAALHLVARQGDHADIQRWEADFADADAERPCVLRLRWNTRILIGYEDERGAHRPLPGRRTGRRCVLYTREPEVELRFASLELNVTPRRGRPSFKRGRFILLR